MIRGKVWKLGCLAALASWGAATADGPAKSAPAGPRLESYVDADGKGYFSLLLRDEGPATPRCVDLALWVDTSAAQAGERHDETIKLVRGLVAGLPKGSRLQIWRSNRPDGAMLATPATVGSAAANAALDELAMTTPLGTSDVPGLLAATGGWLQGAGGLPKTLVYVGDGRSTGPMLTLKAVDPFRERLVARGIPFHCIMVGNLLDADLLQATAAKTGGRVFRRGSGDSSDSFAKTVAEAVARPVCVVRSLKLGPNVVEVLPSSLPPLRSDVETLVVGRWKGGAAMSVALDAARDGQPAGRAFEVAAAKTKGEATYLRDLVAHWSQHAGEVALRDGPTALKAAKVATAGKAERFLAEAQSAVASRRLPIAEDLYTAALKIEPGNPEAMAGLRVVSRLKAGDDPRPTAQPAGDVAPKTSERDMIADSKAREAVEAQRISRAVAQAIQEATKTAKSDPDGAIRLLKGALDAVEGNPVLDSERTRTLRSRLELQLRTLSNQRRRLEAEQMDRDKVFAQMETRRRQDRLEETKQLTAKELSSRFSELFEAGQFGMAEQAANQIQELDPDLVFAPAAQAENRLRLHHTLINGAENMKREGWWQQLYQVEQAAIPMPDEPPITYTSPAAWEELSRRRAKYKVWDIAPPTPAEEKIRGSLAQPITLNFDQTSLGDAVSFLRDFSGVNIVLDKAALAEANVDVDTPVSLEVEGISLRSALKLMLTPLELSYLVENEVLLITSKSATDRKLITKVYYMADLILPVMSFGTMGGGGGGMGMGGMGGGGMGGGGLGGGGLGGGGGMAGGAGGAGGGGGGGFFGGRPDGGGGGYSRIAAPAKTDRSATAKTPASTKAAAAKKSPVAPTNAFLQLVRRAAPNLVPGKRPIADGPATPAEWDAHFASGAESPEAMRSAVATLSKANRHDQIVPMLQAALRHQRVEPWVYGALGMSLQIEGASADQVRNTLLSPVGLAPESLDLRLAAAQGLAAAGQGSAALTVLREAAERFPNAAAAYLQAFDLAEKANDVDGMAWATDQLVSREWPRGGEAVHREIRNRAEIAVAGLRRSGQGSGADRLQAVIRAVQRRDLEITVQWDGEADVDMCVVEPGDILCSARTPRTVNGGVLVSDTISASERYVAAEAFSGNYEILLKRVWGQPTGGVATVDIVRHRGTPKERRDRRTVSVTGTPSPIPVELTDGRRRRQTAVQPEEIAPPPPRQAVQAKDRPAAELRRLLAVGNIDGEPRDKGEGTKSGGGKEDGWRIKGNPPFNQVGGFGGVIAFDPIVTLIPEGTFMSVTAVVSYDRRYVRMNLAPFVTSIDSIQNVRTITVQGAAS